MDIITRSEAKAKGLKHYYTGKPCNHGHLAPKAINGGCVECAKARHNKWREANPETYKQSAQRFREDNQEKIRQWARDSYAANPQRMIGWVNKYRAKKLSAIPGWYEEALVARVYEKAKHYGLAVDHIVPLQSDLVCGLHCWSNLQLLDPKLNSSKSNRHWPDMP